MFQSPSPPPLPTPSLCNQQHNNQDNNIIGLQTYCECIWTYQSTWTAPAEFSPQRTAWSSCRQTGGWRAWARPWVRWTPGRASLRWQAAGFPRCHVLPPGWRFVGPEQRLEWCLRIARLRCWRGSPNPQRQPVLYSNTYVSNTKFLARKGKHDFLNLLHGTPLLSFWNKIACVMYASSKNRKIEKCSIRLGVYFFGSFDTNLV